MKTILLAEKEFSEKAIARLKNVGRVIPFGSLRQFKNNLLYADVLLTALEVRLDASLLNRASKLRLIASRTTQLRYIDLDACARRGIRVINIKANSLVLRRTPSTAEEAMALILALVRNIPWAFDAIKREQWERHRYGGHEVYGKTLGLIGFGRLGRLVARYSRAFGMTVIASDPHVDVKTMQRYGVHKVTLERLLRKSDIVSLHATYHAATMGMLAKKHFRMMRREAVFINTARGEMTDEIALHTALEHGWIAGAAVDTLAGESSDGAHLRQNLLVQYARRHENLIIVPHLGGATQEATQRTQEYISDLVIKAIPSL